MTRRPPVHRIDRNAPVHVLTAGPRGLAWRSLPISRTTPRSVFLSTSLGELQLPRQELERRGRVDIAGEVFSLHRFEIPVREREIVMAVANALRPTSGATDERSQMKGRNT